MKSHRPGRAIPFRRYMELVCTIPVGITPGRTRSAGRGLLYQFPCGDLFGRVMSDVIEEMRRFCRVVDGCCGSGGGDGRLMEQMIRGFGKRGSAGGAGVLPGGDESYHRRLQEISLQSALSLRGPVSDLPADAAWLSAMSCWTRFVHRI